MRKTSHLLTTAFDGVGLGKSRQGQAYRRYGVSLFALFLNGFLDFVSSWF